MFLKVNLRQGGQGGGNRQVWEGVLGGGGTFSEIVSP